MRRRGLWATHNVNITTHNAPQRRLPEHTEKDGVKEHLTSIRVMISRRPPDLTELIKRRWNRKHELNISNLITQIKVSGRTFLVQNERYLRNIGVLTVDFLAECLPSILSVGQIPSPYLPAALKVPHPHRRAFATFPTTCSLWFVPCRQHLSLSTTLPLITAPTVIIPRTPSPLYVYAFPWLNVKMQSHKGPRLTKLGTKLVDVVLAIQRTREVR